jgi:hypothetical protein
LQHELNTLQQKYGADEKLIVYVRTIADRNLLSNQLGYHFYYHDYGSNVDKSMLFDDWKTMAQSSPQQVHLVQVWMYPTFMVLSLQLGERVIY